MRGAQWLLSQVDLLRNASVALLASPRRPAGEGAEGGFHACAEIADRLVIVDWLTQPLRIVLAGAPNVGKSSLANALADRAVSVVSPTPGTTRDWVEVPGELQGFPVLWLDTAGLRDSTDHLEQAGVVRTRNLIQQTDAVLAVLDVTAPDDPGQRQFLATCADLPVIAVAANKIDRSPLTPAFLQALPATWRDNVVPISATEPRGLDKLAQVMVTGLGRGAAQLALPAACTARQAALLRTAAATAAPEALRAILRTA